MKICPKCGKEFDDDTRFCSACGTELLSPDSCPKCGAPVNKDSNFCPKCGARLTHVRKCKECGFETTDAYDFCPKCGKSLDEQYVSNGARSSTFSSSSKIKQIISYVALAFVAIASLLLIIGWFGDIIGGSGTGIRAGKSIGYYFGDAMKSINELKQYNHMDAYNYSLITFVIDCIFYFGGIIISVFMLILGFVDASKKYKENKPVDLTPFVVCVLCAIPHLVFLAIRSSASATYSGTSISVGYGWGSNLLIASIFIVILTVFAQKIANAVVDKKNYIAQIVSAIAATFMIIICLWGNNLVVSYSESSSRIEICGFSILESLIQSISSTSSHTVPKEFGDAVVGCIFIVVSSAFMLGALATMMKKKPSIAGPTIMTLVSMVCTIVAAALLSNTVKASFGGSVIMAIVLSAVTLITLIAIPFTANLKKN